MKNKPIIINNIDDFHKYFGNPDNFLVLKIRKLKLERLKSQIEQVKADKVSYSRKRQYEKAVDYYWKQKELEDKLDMLINTK